MDNPHPAKLACTWPEKQPALLGCSGGADSVALLLLALQAGWQAQLQVVHCHHGLRPEAEAEAEFVSQLCAQHQVPFHLCRLQLDPEAKNLQEQARQARLEAFAQLAAKEHIQLLFLAHHQDDQAETVLWHLLRGSGSKGLAGMSWRSDFPLPTTLDLEIFRPLLTIRRNAIEAYLEARGQDWCSDASNESLQYQRNRLRLQALPQLAQLTGRELTQPLARSAEILAAEDQLLSELSQEKLQQLQDPESPELDCHGLLQLPLALQRRVLQGWLQSQNFSPSFQQVEALRQLAEALHQPGGSPARLQLSQTQEVRRQQATLRLQGNE